MDLGRTFGMSRSALGAAGMSVLVVALSILPFGGWVVAYLAFVLATAFAVRSVPATPGSLLRRRRTRRAIVGLLVIICILFVAPTPPELGVWLVIAGILLDIALGRATRRIAAAPDALVDEREEQFRNRVHRTSYWILAAVLGLGLVVANCASLETRRWVWDAMHGGALLLIGQLGFFLPAMTLAWLEADANAPETRAPRPSRRTALALVMVVVALVIPFMLSLAVALAPVRTTEATITPSRGAGPGDTCVLLHARKTVGWGMGAVFPSDGLVCADGVRAEEAYGFNQSDCHPNFTDSVVVITLKCSRWTDPAGAMHFVYAARVQAGLLPFISRDVELHATVDREGHVVEFP